MPASSSSLSTFVHAVTDTEVAEPELSVRQSVGLLQALSGVRDPRRRSGRRHGLQSILTTAVCAVLAGARSYAAIGDWAVAARPALGVCGRPPHAATFRRVIMSVDPVALQAALTAWALSCLAAAADADLADTTCPRNARRQVVSADGKNLRGAVGPDGQQAKLLAIIDGCRGLVLTQTEIVEGNEIAAFTTGLDTLPCLRGWLITADALHTQRAHADYLLSRGAHYLFTVKANQPSLRRALAALPWSAAPKEQDPGAPRRHGREEHRTVTVIDLDGTPAAGLFPGATRALKVVRRRTEVTTGKTTSETVYAITSLGHRYADAVLLATWLRGHWRIENMLHWVRDVTLGEDASKIRLGAGPQNMALLRNTTISISRLNGHENIAAAQRHYSWTHGAALDAVTAA